MADTLADGRGFRTLVESFNGHALGIEGLARVWRRAFGVRLGSPSGPVRARAVSAPVRLSVSRR